MLLETWNFKNELQYLYFSYGCGSWHLPVSLQIYKAMILASDTAVIGAMWVITTDVSFFHEHVATGIKKTNSV